VLHVFILLVCAFIILYIFIFFFFFFSSRRRHTRCYRDWSSDVCSSDLYGVSLLAGGSILAIMVLPFIISISREVLLAVPREQRRSEERRVGKECRARWGRDA